MENFVTEVCRRLFGLNVSSIKTLDSYDDKNYHVHGSFHEPRKQLQSENGYVLKILHSVDSKDLDFIDGQHCMAKHLYDRGISTPKPIPNISGSLYSVEKVPLLDDGDHVVRLLSFLPGKMLCDVPFTPRTLYNAGQYAGRMDQLLKDFHHPSYDHHEIIWNPSSIPKLRDYLHYVSETDDRRLLEEVITSFENDVIPLYDQFQSGIIHCDFHDANIVVEPVSKENGLPLDKNEPDHKVLGIIDFADSTNFYFVYEITIFMTYIILHSTSSDPITEAKHALSGYVSVFELNDAELKIIRSLICSRIATSLIMSKRKASEEPSNMYAQKSLRKGWSFLRLLWGTIHCDYHDDNIVVEPVKGENGVASNHKVSGILDFGDSAKYYFVYEIAIFMSYIILHSTSPNNVHDTKYALSGYRSEFELTDVELKSLRRLICSRIAQSVILGARKASEKPLDEYVKKSSRRARTFLRMLWGMTDGDFLLTVVNKPC